MTDSNTHDNTDITYSILKLFNEEIFLILQHIFNLFMALK